MQLPPPADGNNQGFLAKMSLRPFIVRFPIADEERARRQTEAKYDFRYLDTYNGICHDETYCLPEYVISGGKEPAHLSPERLRGRFMDVNTMLAFVKQHRSLIPDSTHRRIIEWVEAQTGAGVERICPAPDFRQLKRNGGSLEIKDYLNLYTPKYLEQPHLFAEGEYAVRAAADRDKEKAKMNPQLSTVVEGAAAAAHQVSATPLITDTPLTTQNPKKNRKRTTPMDVDKQKKPVVAKRRAPDVGLPMLPPLTGPSDKALIAAKSRVKSKPKSPVAQQQKTLTLADIQQLLAAHKPAAAATAAPAKNGLTSIKRSGGKKPAAAVAAAPAVVPTAARRVTTTYGSKKNVIESKNFFSDTLRSFFTDAAQFKSPDTVAIMFVSGNQLHIQAIGSRNQICVDLA
jgi:hypothetical protein